MIRPAPDPILADEASRRLAQSEFEHPVVVVAGAGTGKTALLVARVAAWCVGPGWERHSEQGVDRQTVARRVIERVVAITFTEAAAAEMAHKIGIAFLDLAAGDPPVGWDPDPAVITVDREEVMQRARALSEEGHRLVVSTIHAFCQRLLATYPLEAGLHPRFEVDAEGARIEALAEEVVEEALRGLGADPNYGDWERLAVEGVGPAKIVEALCQLVEAGVEPELFGEDPFNDRVAKVSMNRLLSALNLFADLVGDRLAVVSGSVSESTRDDIVELRQRMIELDSTASIDDLAAVAGLVSPKTVARLKKWSRLDFTGSESDCLGDTGYEVAAVSGEIAAALDPLTDLHRDQLAAARAVVAPLLDVLQRRRSAAGLVTFSDLLRRAERLLADSGGVRREVVAGIDHLLVDEFQDTDDVQCRLVEWLALTGEPAARPSLFIVGDPKQSIYAWRSADLAAYDAFVVRVVDAGGVTVDLVRNFRSVTPVLDEVERLVAPVMRPEEGIQPRFQRLEATGDRRDVPGIDHPEWMTVEHWVTWPRGEEGVGPEKGSSSRTTSALEAGALAADIRRLHDQGVIEEWSDVAVLLRVTTAQEELLQAFREVGIPYEVARERDYYRQREVVEMAALVRCVLEPTDALALLTVLRSDVVGVPDAALAPLWDTGFPGRMARLSGPDSPAADALNEGIETARVAAPSGLSGGDALPNWPAAVQTAVEVIAQLRRSLREDPPDVFVEKIRTLWLAEVTAAVRYLGGFRRARIERFLDDLESTLVGGEGGDAELARFLRVAVEEGQESRVPVPPDLKTDAVHVMTIHRAKGLDFEHVYVAQIHKGGRGGGARNIAALRRIDDWPEYRLFGWMTPGFAAAEWVQTQKTRAEMVRLLYVAATRAKKRLVISGGWGEPGVEVFPESAPDFARLIGRRLDPESMARQIDAEAERQEDEFPHVLRVMPVFGVRFEAVEVTAEGQPGWSVPEGCLQRAVELAAARRAAADRMAQPVFRSASAEAHDRLRRAEAEGADSMVEGPFDQGLAMTLGTAVHEMLEVLDLDRELTPQIAEHRAGIVSELGSGRDREEAGRRAEELLTRIAEGECLRRLGSVAPNVLSRELPVLLWSEEEGAPGAVVSGIVDL
ncbi:MAG: UvrD-helicase domain-containing protein, partial [Acidobacteria bacterium]|nr:UvrD-helicase domain-containing protein [Candidatus Sulfomarinibacter sp. MAG AM1]